MGGTITRFRKFSLFLVFVSFFIGFFSPPKKVQAQGVEYTQTSLVPFVLTLEQASVFIISLLPDPDSSVDESMMFYTPIVFDTGDNTIPTNIVRRNPLVDTFSEAIGVHRNSTAVAPLVPMGGNEDFVTLIGPGQSGSGILFEATPLSTYNFPVGSSLFAATLADVPPSVLFSQEWGCGPITSVDLPNFQFGVQGDQPLINKFYTSGPFPTVNDNPATFITGTINSDTPTNETGGIGGSANHDQLVFFGDTVDTLFGLTVGKIPVTQFGDLGAPTRPGEGTGCLDPSNPPWPRGPLAATRPILGDFDGDGNTDLVVLVNIDENNYGSYSPPLTPPQDFIARFKGNGAGGLTNLGDVPLGNNISVFDLAKGDFNVDGVDDILITYPVPRDSFSNAPFVQIITDPLGAFNVVAGPSLPSGMRPLFADGGDCDGDGKANDVFLTGAQVEVDASNNPTKLNSTDVICLIGGQSIGPVVFPASKMNISLPASLGSIFTIPFTTGVGKIGCDTGWTGINLLLGGDTNTNNTIALFQILIAERLDCNPYFKFISGEGQACSGLQGSGCANSIAAPTTERFYGVSLYWLLFLLPLVGYVTFVLIRLRERARS